MLFELSLYKVRSFRYGTLVGLLVSLGEFGVLFALSLFLQAVYGYSEDIPMTWSSAATPNRSSSGRRRPTPRP